MFLFRTFVKLKRRLALSSQCDMVTLVRGFLQMFCNSWHLVCKYIARIENKEDLIEQN